MVTIQLDRPRKGFFEKLGQPPWSERHARLIYWVCGLAFTASVVTVLLNADDAIPILMQPSVIDPISGN